ncbi:MAG: GNAT family N-acetyltransferase [Cyanobacteria bacterium SID2]|nr:GNAT family N-acetyltransferase [Cyanobacteria bacterium SID2]MBP0004460.1 GNAT family N-acetyltransferase [Cyanobacteria bacterium SBC]
MFGRQNFDALSQLVARARNCFSYRYITVAESQGEVVGMVVLIPGDRLQENADEREVFPLQQRLWLKLIRRWFLRYVLKQDFPADSLYIGNLAVSPEYRNRGIGRQLLLRCMAEAERTGKSLFISVDVENLRAQKLYESLGFQVVEVKAIRGFGLRIGSRVLQLRDGS